MDLNQGYRKLVLALALHRGVRNLVVRRGRAFSRRFVAGDALGEALPAVDALAAQGVRSILCLLGESVTGEAQARRFQAGILELVRALAPRPHARYVSLKLTQLGLDLSPSLAEELLLGVLDEAARSGCFVRIDMEDSPRADATLRLYRRAREAGRDNVGVVLQSCLRRTPADLEELLPLRPSLRIVKGAYKEPADAAYLDARTIDAQYLAVAKRALEAGLPTALATHDPRILDGMLRWAGERRIDPGLLEVQMLYGVRRDEQKRLAALGHAVRAYVPYGTDWYPYLSRRIAERPENLLFVARSLLGR
jgi:proline dehydrogenase